MKKFLDILKKVIIGIVIFSVLMLLGAYLYMKYDEHREKADQSIAFDCKTPEDEIAEKYNLDELHSYKYFLIESSPKSRSTKDYYSRAFEQEIDNDYELIEDDVKIDSYYYWSDAYGILRTNKYIHLFEWLSSNRYFYEIAQDKLEIHQELIDEIAAGNHDYKKDLIPSFSFNRETLELTDWNTAKSLNSSPVYSCEEIDSRILFKRVKETEIKAKGGDKKL